MWVVRGTNMLISEKWLELPWYIVSAELIIDIKPREWSVSHSTQETSHRKEIVHEVSWAEDPLIANSLVLEPKERKCSCVPGRKVEMKWLEGSRSICLKKGRQEVGVTVKPWEKVKPTAAGGDGQRRRNAFRSWKGSRAGLPPNMPFAGTTAERLHWFKRRRCRCSVESNHCGVVKHMLARRKRGYPEPCIVQLPLTGPQFPHL